MPGPYVQIATLCEQVLQERDGVLSIIRCIDQLTVVAAGDHAPTDLPEGRLTSTLLICLKPDDARGRYQVVVETEQPSGVTLDPQAFDVTFDGGNRGVNIIVKLDLDAIEGLYWFNIRLKPPQVEETQLLTRVPLQVIYQRLPRAR